MHMLLRLPVSSFLAFYSRTGLRMAAVVVHGHQAAALLNDVNVHRALASYQLRGAAQISRLFMWRYVFRSAVSANNCSLHNRNILFYTISAVFIVAWISSLIPVSRPEVSFFYRVSYLTLHLLCFYRVLYISCYCSRYLRILPQIG
jgi:hypothetical protein